MGTKAAAFAASGAGHLAVPSAYVAAVQAAAPGRVETMGQWRTGINDQTVLLRVAAGGP